jgi:hypothetical protein
MYIGKKLLCSRRDKLGLMLAEQFGQHHCWTIRHTDMQVVQHHCWTIGHTDMQVVQQHCWTIGHTDMQVVQHHCWTIGHTDAQWCWTNFIISAHFIYTSQPLLSSAVTDSRSDGESSEEKQEVTENNLMQTYRMYRHCVCKRPTYQWAAPIIIGTAWEESRKEISKELARVWVLRNMEMRADGAHWYVSPQLELELEFCGSPDWTATWCVASLGWNVLRGT